MVIIVDFRPALNDIYVKSNSAPSLFAFPGTPIEITDTSTYGVFCDLIDVYDMTQVVDDGANHL